MIKHLRLILPLLFTAIIFSSCNQDPTSIASDLVPPEDKVEFNRFDTYELGVKQSSSNYEKLENLFNGDKRILGKNDYAKSSILLGWGTFFPDSIKTYLKNGQINIISAKVSMARSYYLGDTTGFFDFTVNKITGDWNLVRVHRDTLKYINRESIDIAFNKTRTDSTVVFDLNNNVVLDWLKYDADSTIAPKNNGIILTPTNSTNFFLGFNATISYSSIPQTTMTIIFEKPSSFRDTIAFYPNKDLHVIENLQSTTPSHDKIYLQGGYAFRGNVFFDLSAIPKQIAISKATLEFTIDTQSSTDGNPSSDSLFVHILKDSTEETLADSTITTLLTKSGDKFSGDITWIVQKWNSGTDNQGVHITLFDEYSSAARIVLFGSKYQNALLRPRLTIYYPKKI